MKAFKQLVSIGLASNLGFSAPLFADTHCAPNSAPEPSQNWAQFAYPESQDITIASNSAFGLSGYCIQAYYTGSDSLDLNAQAFTLGLSQTLSIYDWFYIQLREDASLGFASKTGTNTGTFYTRRLNKSWFFDADAKLYVPFSISCENRLSLQPVIGFAVNQSYIQGKKNTTASKETLLRQRFFAPLFGLALGYNPTNSFAMRSSINMHIPHGKHKDPSASSANIRRYNTLNIARHGASWDFLAFMKLTPQWTLTGELEYRVYSLYGPSISSNFQTNYTSRFSTKWGISYQF